MRKQVVGGLAVLVHLAVERQRRIPSLPELEDLPSAGMRVQEPVDRMHEPVHHDQRLALLDSLVHLDPRHDGERRDVLAPVDGLLGLVELGLLDLDLGLLDLVLREPDEAGGEAEPGEDADDPLGGVVVVPADAVAVVVGELVVVVVVALAEGDEGGDDGVVGGVFLGVGLLAEGVGEGVDAEGRLVDEEHPAEAGVDEGAPEVAPAEVADGAGEDEAEEEGDPDVVLVLELEDLGGVEVGDVDAAGAVLVLLENHPPEVRIPEALVDGVRVLLGVDIAVVRAVVAGPPTGGALERGGAPRGEDELDGERRVKGAVGPEAVVSSGDAEAGEEVLDSGEDEGGGGEGNEEGAEEEAEERGEDDGGREPVDALQEGEFESSLSVMYFEALVFSKATPRAASYSSVEELTSWCDSISASFWSGMAGRRVRTLPEVLKEGCGVLTEGGW
eukprot:CAMPEP_0184734054 /NCGR_PEP_ID=MMETSP0314-20130426/59356_1 /TAXON_ID=38298 /ORGANISM="Rhodella maculata, Strain CCMP 736" /LENGTH=444 /DNA_ID=CAMNT_0027200953 /DNA_START=196 /DNA_END=1528 /DNA_ORIENTATION=-